MSTLFDPNKKTFSTLPLGDFKLDSGEILENAVLAYEVYGEPSSPVVLYPTWFSGLISDNMYLLTSPQCPFSPSTHCIIIPAMFSNSQSTSPSNSSQRPFPRISIIDNLNAQHILLKHLNVTSISVVVGWSMGGIQALHWGAKFPSFFKPTERNPQGGKIISICATAKCSDHNAVFLDGVKSALLPGLGLSSTGIGKDIPGIHGALRGISQERKDAALKAMGRVYAGWGFSQQFYREKGYVKLGYPTLEAFMTGFWEKWSCSKDIENILSMIQTWQNADIGLVDAKRDAITVLERIEAPTLILPGKQDLYFTPEDAYIEHLHMPNSNYYTIPGTNGHWAGGPGGDSDFINECIKEFLSGKWERSDKSAIAKYMKEVEKRENERKVPGGSRGRDDVEASVDETGGVLRELKI